ncbi:hypothetical protein [Streptomyces avermitilis]|uniref:hypothetical protein n=1 Tax=Streptomyces avermitilis TaxID=33903 RepID=UPI0033BF5AEF
MENWNSANTVLPYGKDDAPGRPDKEHNVNPYGTYRLGMDKRLDLGTSAGVPQPRNPG